VQPASVKHLYDTDELSVSPSLQPISGRVKNAAGVAEGGAANATFGSEEKAVQSGSAVEDNKENIPKTASSKGVRDLILCLCFVAEHGNTSMVHVVCGTGFARNLLTCMLTLNYRLKL
jgi:hypothetical protein